MEKNEENVEVKETEEVKENVEEKVGDAVGNIGDKITKIGGKISNGIEKGKKKINEKGSKTEGKKVKPLVEARVLFITILDKVLLALFILLFVSATYNAFSGNLSSVNYNFWGRVGGYVITLIVLAIVYFFWNWLYSCLAKTMISLTKTQIHIEKYVPFKKLESSIPLGKVTRATTVDIIWIFRLLIIHQYHQLPIIFWTWNNHAFKDKLNELVLGENEQVENEFNCKNILPKSWEKYLKYVAVGLVALITLIGVARLFASAFSPAKKVPGSYTFEDKNVVLSKDGTCELTGFNSNKVSECEWNYNEETSYVYITYKYVTTSSFYGEREYSSSMNMSYNKDDKTLTYDGKVLKK